ncbi:MAG: hypothetical protein ACRDTF_12570, partial [Pseudonocardiaceae bacterium]
GSVVCPPDTSTRRCSTMSTPASRRRPTAPKAREQAIRQQGRLYPPDQLARDVDRNQAVIVALAIARVAWWLSR